MLFEVRRRTEEDKVKCGKCSSEYYARIKLVQGKSVKDWSCPVCGHGLKEARTTPNKKILLD